MTDNLEYQARYFDGVESRARDIVVVIDGFASRLLLRTDSGDLSWPLAGIEYFPGPDRDTCRLGLDEGGDARLIIRDAAFLSMMDRTFPDWRKTAKKDRNNYRVLAGWLVLSVMLGAGAWYSLPSLSETVASLVPEEWENNIGAVMTRSMDRGFGVCEGEEGLAALSALEARLSTTGPASGTTFRIAVVDTGQVNAVALPGGNIRIFRGFLQEASGPDEVAGVLAHEMGHVVERHVLEGLIEQVGMATLAELLTGGGGDIAAIVTKFRYSQDKEHEADKFALQVLNEQHIDAAPMAGFFDRLAEKEKKRQKKAVTENDSKDTQTDKGDGIVDGAWKSVSDFFRTHPDSESRAEFLRQGQRTDTAFTPSLSAGEWQALQDICKVTDRQAE